MVYSLASMSILRLFFVRVAEVTGPMLAILMPLGNSTTVNFR